MLKYIENKWLNIILNKDDKIQCVNNFVKLYDINSEPSDNNGSKYGTYKTIKIKLNNNEYFLIDYNPVNYVHEINNKPMNIFKSKIFIHNEKSYLILCTNDMNDQSNDEQNLSKILYLLSTNKINDYDEIPDLTKLAIFKIMLDDSNFKKSIKKLSFTLSEIFIYAVVVGIITNLLYDILKWLFFIFVNLIVKGYYYISTLFQNVC